jgi:uncharacterized membrane protein YkvA (DUF1232 family)
MPTAKKNNGHVQAAEDKLTNFFGDPASKRLTTAEYVAQGVPHVTNQHLDQLQQRLGQLRQRIVQIEDSARLQMRLTVLALYFEETGSGREQYSAARKEVAFALIYFSQASDRIPDGVPEYGLLDDALVVEAVLERNSAALREHWHRAGRELIEPL